MSPTRYAIVFDWNGTLLADAALCVRANNKTLELFGQAPVSLERYRAAYTIPLFNMYKEFGCSEKDLIERKQEIFDVFARHYEKGARTLRPRKGARKALEAFRERQHKIVILSNYTISAISKEAARLKLLDHFDSILANDVGGEILHKKGKGERLKAFVEENETAKAIVVGDTPEEIEIAHHYGYVGVALTHGVCSTSRLRAAKPDFLIDSLDQMPAIAQRVFGGGGA